MTRYAKNTSVPVDRSMNQIRMMLQKENADGVAIAETSDKAAVQFVFEQVPYKFVIKYPIINEDEIKYTNSGKERTLAQKYDQIDKEKRRLWRAMCLYIKAALEAHNNGLVDIKRSMMGNLMLQNGQTLYEKHGGDFEKVKMDAKLLIE